jgi:hypothetical protein
MTVVHVAMLTGRLMLGIAPAFLLGLYLLFGASYCYRKGEVGFRSSATVTRRESLPRFICGVALIALCGVAFIALAIYSLVRGAG